MGTFTDITDIIAPSEAAYGDTLTVEVRVKNLYSEPLSIAVGGRANGIIVPFGPESATVLPGHTYAFIGHFVMPNRNVRLEAWSSCWKGVEWYQLSDDYAYVDIALKEVEIEPEFQNFGIAEYQTA